MDSTWEIELAKRLDTKNIRWARNDKFLLYTLGDGKQRKYYPDFYLLDFDIYIEVKGYWTPQSRYKMIAVMADHDITLLILDSIALIKSFCVEKYL